MDLRISQSEAAEAAAQILRIASDIPALDPKAFSAALAGLLSTYPRPVVKRAADPIGGIAVHVERLNLARIKKLLDSWYDEHFQDMRRKEIADMKRLPEPKPDPQVKHRVENGFKQLKNILQSGLVP